MRLFRYFDSFLKLEIKIVLLQLADIVDILFGALLILPHHVLQLPIFSLLQVELPPEGLLFALQAGVGLHDALDVVDLSSEVGLQFVDLCSFEE